MFYVCVASSNQRGISNSEPFGRVLEVYRGSSLPSNGRLHFTYTGTGSKPDIKDSVSKYSFIRKGNSTLLFKHYKY
jgi:hypothetical protein